MSGFVYQTQSFNTACVETITGGHTVGEGSTIRPAEIQWHLVFVTYQGRTQALAVGPLTTAGVVSFTEGAEILWIKFQLGAFMPHLPTRKLLNTETVLPEAGRHSFWLNGAAWPFPNFENADTFARKLAREAVVVHDAAVPAALQRARPEMSSRTLRHRFLRATGLAQNHVHQFERAQRAAALLRQGVSILDAVSEAGYFDQPHLTRSLKQFLGYTPAQLKRLSATG